MIRTLRAFYLLRPLREKILLVALLLILVVWWLVNLGGRIGGFYTAAHTTSLELADQSEWLGRREEIIESARVAADKFEQSRMLDGTRLLATVSQLASDAGLRNAKSDEAQNVSSGQFAIHTLPFNVTKADWNSLKSFYVALQGYAPYISIEQFSVRAEPANPSQLDALLKLSSVEIIPTR